MSDIEDEIRRRMIAEREQATLELTPPPDQVTQEYAWPPPTTHDQPVVPITAPLTSVTSPKQPGTLARWKAKGGPLGAIATALIATFKFLGPVLAVLGKLKFLAIGLKFLLTGGTMLLSMWAYSRGFGWPLAVGLVMLIFIHECGHALAARLRGIKTGIMVFVPFMGAFVTTKRYGLNLEEDAFIGIMGPVVGSLASLVALLIYFPTHNRFWIDLGQLGFFINLFNLLPTPPLDGGWIVPLFSPKLLAIGMVIAFVVGFKNPLIWLLLIMSIPRIVGGWKADPATQPYYRVETAAKWKYGIAYLSLAAALAVGQHAAQIFILQ